MRRRFDEAIAHVEYLWGRLAGDPEHLFQLQDGELDPTSGARIAYHRAVMLSCLGRNDEAMTEVRVAIGFFELRSRDEED